MDDTDYKFKIVYKGRFGLGSYHWKVWYKGELIGQGREGILPYAQDWTGRAIQRDKELRKML